MYFKRIEMHGFKSFADPVVIDFHPGVTCIVGPNGSGKSNISDAIRWVLGEQSPKMLRFLVKRVGDIYGFWGLDQQWKPGTIIQRLEASVCSE